MGLKGSSGVAGWPGNPSKREGAYRIFSHKKSLGVYRGCAHPSALDPGIDGGVELSLSWASDIRESYV
jgi:hypothetical protein